MGLTKVPQKRALMETCEWCNQVYNHVGKPTKHKFCSAYCRDAIKIGESNKRWLEREPRKVDPRLSQRVEMAKQYPSMMNAELKKFYEGKGSK